MDSNWSIFFGGKGEPWTTFSWHQKGNGHEDPGNVHIFPHAVEPAAKKQLAQKE